MADGMITRRTLFDMLAGVYAAFMPTPEPTLTKEWVCRMFEVPLSIAFGDGDLRRLRRPDWRGGFVKGYNKRKGVLE